MQFNKFVQMHNITLLITYTITRTIIILVFHQHLFRVPIIMLDFFINTYHCNNIYYNNDDSWISTGIMLCFHDCYQTLAPLLEFPSFSSR